jgi:hypothetical protein
VTEADIGTDRDRSIQQDLVEGRSFDQIRVRAFPEAGTPIGHGEVARYLTGAVQPLTAGLADERCGQSFVDAQPLEQRDRCRQQ